jgi:hypothetical protein
MAPHPVMKEAPSSVGPAGPLRDARGDREAADLLEMIRRNSASFSSSVQALLASQRERLELAEQQRLHGSLVRTAGLFALGTALGCAVLLVVRGVVLGLTELLGGRAWLASLAAGLIVLLAFLAAFLAATAYLGHLRESVRTRRGPTTSHGHRRRSSVTRRTLF